MTERERLVKIIANSPAHFCDGCKESPEERAESVEKLADYLIASDVVEVVRCRDCKHAREVRHRGEVMEGIYRCSYLKPNTDMFDIDYCRYGKRREE